MLKIIKLLLLLLATMAGACNAAHLRFAIANAMATRTQIAQISPEIVNELRDFLDLIPTVTVDEIVAKHLLIDGEFRRAFKFVKSAEFEQLLQRAQQIPEVIEILDFLHVNSAAGNSTVSTTNTVKTIKNIIVRRRGSRFNAKNAYSDKCSRQSSNAQIVEYGIVNAANTTANGNEMEFVLLEFGSGGSHKAATHNLRTFSTFVEELLEHLPRDRYTQMINEKRQRNAAFAQFYAALRSAQLRPMVETALKSTNLAYVIDTLHSKAIDANGLVPIAFNLISWGPQPTDVQ